MKRKKAFVRSLLPTSLFLMAMTGMAFGGGQQEAGIVETEENTLRWSNAADAAIYDPHSFGNILVTLHMKNLYETLTTLDENLEFEPCLAVSYELVDETTWQYNLRKDVTFHDGTPFTAEDVKFSIERAQTPPSQYISFVKEIKEVKVIDLYTIHIITYNPFPLLPAQLMEIFIMSKEWCEMHGCTTAADHAAQEESYSVRNVNGTGPFILESREPEVKTVWVKNPNWWGLEAYPHNFDRVVFTPIANDATRVAALISGEIDFLRDPPLQDRSRIDSTPGLKVAEKPGTRYIFFGPDIASPELRTSNIKGKNPFADVQVRRAMNMAIDREAIKDVIMRGLSYPVSLPISPGNVGYPEDLAERKLYDLDKAKQLMIEAGYPDGFEVTINASNNRYINDEAIAQAVVGMLGKIGIDATLVAQPLSIHFPEIRNHKHDLYLLGLDTLVLDSYLHFNMSYTSDGNWNFTGYSNPRLDELVAASSRETNEEKRLQMIREAWEIVSEDEVYLPIHVQYLLWAMKDNINLPLVSNNVPQFKFGSMD